MWYTDTFENDTRFGSNCLRKQLKLLVLALEKGEEEIQEKEWWQLKMFRNVRFSERTRV